MAEKPVVVEDGLEAGCAGRAAKKHQNKDINPTNYLSNIPTCALNS